MGVSNGEQQGRAIACGRRCVAYRPNSRPLWGFENKKSPHPRRGVGEGGNSEENPPPMRGRGERQSVSQCDSSVSECDASHINAEPLDATVGRTLASGYGVRRTGFLGELSHTDSGHGAKSRHRNGQFSHVRGDNSVVQVRLLASFRVVPFAGYTLVRRAVFSSLHQISVSLASVGFLGLRFADIRDGVAVFINDSLGHPRIPVLNGFNDGIGLHVAVDGVTSRRLKVSKVVSDNILVRTLGHSVRPCEGGGDVLGGVVATVGDVLAENRRAVFHAGVNHVGEVFGELRSCVGDELCRSPSGSVVAGLRVGCEVHDSEVVEGHRQGHTLASGVHELLNIITHRGELCATRGGAVIGTAWGRYIVLWHRLAFLLVLIYDLTSVHRIGLHSAQHIAQVMDG